MPKLSMLAHANHTITSNASVRQGRPLHGTVVSDKIAVISFFRENYIPSLYQHRHHQHTYSIERIRAKEFRPKT